LDSLLQDTIGRSVGVFAPELILCATILLTLFVRLFDADRRLPTYWVALIGSLGAFLLAYFQFIQLRQGSAGSEAYFTGLLVFDQFSVFFRVFLLLFLVLVVSLTILTGLPDLEDGPDFYTLLIGSTVGMMLMASANHLLILFLGVEMASVPSYAMVGFLKGRRSSSEAALKYVVYGAGAAGVMLYGVSLLAGLLGTANLPQIAAQLESLAGSGRGIMDPVVRTAFLGAMMVLAGLAFKLSLVPFHFWCPDAFEGAPAEVAGYLSVASKAAAFALLVRFCLAFAGSDAESLQTLYRALGVGLGLVAVVTATYGNLVAYVQNNMKRLLAYSTIAHAGYMLMAVAALLVINNAPAGTSLDVAAESRRCLEGLLYYLCVYLFMNLGAFAIVALIRNEIFSEDIRDYAGLGFQAPLLGICMAICLFSLTGVPPLGGFVGKLFIFASVVQAAKIAPWMWVVLVLGLLNTVFSLFYYMRVVRAMFLTARPEGARKLEIPFTPIGAYVSILTVPILVLGVYIRGLSDLAQGVAAVFFQ